MHTQKEQERVQMTQNITEWKKAYKCFWYHHSSSKIWKFAKLKRKEGRKEKAPAVSQALPGDRGGEMTGGEVLSAPTPFSFLLLRVPIFSPITGL